MSVPRRPAIDRFAEKVAITEAGCWQWLGGGNRYGTFMNEDQRTVSAHRWAYMNLVGPIPSGMHLDHLCRNTHCVNPGHLEVVTAAENARRAKSQIGAARARMERNGAACPQGHRWTPENTYYRPADGFRECRTCRCERGRKRYAA